METREILIRLCEAAYDGSADNETKKVITEFMKDISDSIKTDALGNLICTLNESGEGNTVLSAHMDKIGMTVTGIDKTTGMLKIDRVGGVDVRVLPASRVKVLGKKTLYGCITSTPPHLARGDKTAALPITELYVDCGLSFEEISSVVSAGDRVLYHSPVVPLIGDRLAGAYMDNSAGCTAVIKAMARLKEDGFGGKVTAVFTVGEETGKGGAQTSFTALAPEFALITDVSFGSAPGIPPESSSPLSSGAMICISPILQKSVSDRLFKTAEKNGIPHTEEVMGSRTMTDSDVAVITGTGVPTGLVSIPLLNMHTPVETLDIKDVEAVASVLYFAAKGE